MENKVYKETIVVTQADNGILFDSTCEENGEKSVTLMLDKNMNENLGKKIYGSIKSVMDNNCANKIKMEITYTPLED